MAIYRIFLFVLIYIAIGCGTSGLSPDKYLTWVSNPKNGLFKEIMAGDIKYAVQYKPLDYVILKRNSNIGIDAYNKRYADYEELEYFDLLIDSTIKRKSNNKEYSSKITQYYSFEIQQDLFLIQGKDTLDCLFTQYDPSFGLRPYEKIVLAFQKRKESSDLGLKLFFDDKISGQQVYFTIDEASLEQIPLIKF